MKSSPYILIGKLMLLCILPLAYLIKIELDLKQVNTHYKSKRIAIERTLPNVEVITLGSSNAYYGIAPGFFSHVGYNLAFNSQSPYYDRMLTMLYVDRAPRLKLVILPAIYFTMGVDLPKLSEA